MHRYHATHVHGAMLVPRPSPGTVSHATRGWAPPQPRIFQAAGCEVWGVGCGWERRRRSGGEVAGQGRERWPPATTHPGRMLMHSEGHLRTPLGGLPARMRLRLFVPYLVMPAQARTRFLIRHAPKHPHCVQKTGP